MLKQCSLKPRPKPQILSKQQQIIPLCLLWHKNMKQLMQNSNRPLIRFITIWQKMRSIFIWRNVRLLLPLIFPLLRLLIHLKPSRELHGECNRTLLFHNRNCKLITPTNQLKTPSSSLFPPPTTRK